MAAAVRETIGIDLGGTKIEAIVRAPDGVKARKRIPAPRGDYGETLRAIAALVSALERERSGTARPVGIGIPGSISRRTGRVHNANSTWLNGRDLKPDLEAALARPVAIANDANCFALSEAADGSAAGATTVLGVILGTGVGSGIVTRGAIHDGPLGIGGEWGHNPLPWAMENEWPGPACWCGRRGCMETWVSGPALAADFARVTGKEAASAEDIATAARSGDSAAKAALDRHASRLARGLAHVVNIVDPDVIVLGGGLSALDHLYRMLPELMKPHVFADDVAIDIRPPKWGDASGVRGAALLAAGND